MNWSAFARALGALVGVGALAVVLFVALVTALGAVGVPRWVATTAAAGAVVPAVLGLADAYTPLGSNARTEQLQEKPAGALAADFALTGAVGGVLAAVGGVALLGPEVGGLARTAVLGAAIAVGYGTFVARNYEVYRPDGPVAAVEDTEVEP